MAAAVGRSVRPRGRGQARLVYASRRARSRPEVSKSVRAPSPLLSLRYELRGPLRDGEVPPGAADDVDDDDSGEEAYESGSSDDDGGGGGDDGGGGGDGERDGNGAARRRCATGGARRSSTATRS